MRRRGTVKLIGMKLRGDAGIYTDEIRADLGRFGLQPELSAVA
jgi:hypothetical protein